MRLLNITGLLTLQSALFAFVSRKRFAETHKPSACESAFSCNAEFVLRQKILFRSCLIFIFIFSPVNESLASLTCCESRVALYMQYLEIFIITFQMASITISSQLRLKKSYILKLIILISCCTLSVLYTNSKKALDCDPMRDFLQRLFTMKRTNQYFIRSIQFPVSTCRVCISPLKRDMGSNFSEQTIIQSNYLKCKIMRERIYVVYYIKIIF